MIKRRKDSGFTLIELMIVIAVIGILAVVLLPRVGVVKAQAKEAGLDTNVRLVQGYVESRIDRWVSKGQTKEAVENAIVSAFTFNDLPKRVVNPVTSMAFNAAIGGPGGATGSIYVMNSGVIGDVSPTTAAGVVVVSVGPNPVDGVTIYAFGANGTLLEEKTVTIRP